MSAWKMVGNKTEIPAGGIVEYKVDYSFPTVKEVESELLKAGEFSLINSGKWWDSYGTVISTNLNFDIVPRNKNGVDGNINIENDWTRIKLVKPKLRDMYISKVEIYRSDSASPIITKEMGGSETGFCYFNSEGGRITKIVIPKSLMKELQVNQNTGQYLASLYAKVYYNYYGKNDVKPIGNWSYLRVSNGYTGAEAIAQASFVNGYNAASDGITSECMKIDLNKAALNENKDKMLSISVPVGENNECRHDWEIVNIVVENDSYNKDNEVLDIMLTTDSGATEFGDSSIYRGGSPNVAQQLGGDYSYANNTAIIVAVKRNAPEDMAWDESKKDGSLDGTLAIEYIKNGMRYVETMAAPNITDNLRWGQGKTLGYSKSNGNCFCIYTLDDGVRL